LAPGETIHEPTVPPRSGPIVPAPGALAPLRTVTASEGFIKLAFSCGGNAEAHEVYRQVDGGVFEKRASDPTCGENEGGVIVDNLVQPETNYCFKVRAFNSTHSAWSNVHCLTTPAPTVAPATPTLVATAVSKTEVALQIRDNSTNERYLRVYRESPSGALTLVGTIYRRSSSAADCYTTGTLVNAHRATGCSVRVADLGLTESTTYCYRAQAGYYLDRTSPDQAILKSGWSRAYAMTPPLPADLEVYAAAPFEPRANWPLTLRFTVCNRGGQPTGVFTTGFDLQGVTTDLPTRFAPSWQAASLAPGECREESFATTPITVGQYAWTVYATPASGVTEPNTANNIRTVWFTVQ
jgi:hypothetical protein